MVVYSGMHTLVGPGGQAGMGKTAVLTGGAQPSVNVGTNANTTLVLDGLEIGTTTKEAVLCGNNGSIAITNSLIGSSSAPTSALRAGVSAASCTIILDANEITGNASGGIVIDTGTTYIITNNLIHDNTGTGSFGVRFNDSPAGSVFIFNTVANNGPSMNTVASGIICNNATATIIDSIVYNNKKTSDVGTQFGGTFCKLQNVVVGTDSISTDPGAGVLNAGKSPILTTSGHLDISTPPALQANSDCCIDQVAAPAAGTPNTGHDVDRTGRPKGSGPKSYDVGAHEAK
jgi:hypothetical protein